MHKANDDQETTRTIPFDLSLDSALLRSPQIQEELILFSLQTAFEKSSEEAIRSAQFVLHAQSEISPQPTTNILLEVLCSHQTTLARSLAFEQIKHTYKKLPCLRSSITVALQDVLACRTTPLEIRTGVMDFLKNHHPERPEDWQCWSTGIFFNTNDYALSSRTDFQ